MTRPGLALALATMLVIPAAVAHHSFTAFHREAEATIRGTVTSYEFRNPHTYIFVDVPQPDGSVLEWKVEGETRNDLFRNGWRDDSVEPGEVINIRIYPPVDSARTYARLRSIEKSDGTYIEIPNDDDERGRENLVPAQSIDGVWLPIQSFFRYRAALQPLINDTARAERETYDAIGALPPNTSCIDMSIPQRLGRAHVYEIETVSDELILIHGEDDAEPRHIYMDGRAHPDTIPDDELSHTGYSLGHWEDNTLVIDTRHFKPQINGNAGLPSGSRKHLIERFTLTEDRTQIEIDVVIEDPEYLTAPLAHSFRWQHSPHITRMPYSCETESALRYLE